MWDFSSPTRMEPTLPAGEAQSPNRWTTQEFPEILYFYLQFCFVLSFNLWADCGLRAASLRSCPA